MPIQSDESTSTAANVVHGRPDDTSADAGLILLFAEDFAALPPAIPLAARATVLGRSEPADVILPHTAVSRLHARISRTDDGYVLRDLDSRNGVLVQGRRITEAVLRPHDVVRIGDALFKFVDRGVHAHAAYRIDGTVAPEARRVTIAGAVGGLQMARVSAEIATIGPTDLPVLISGETGTGKELVARALHEASGRSGPFRAINCAAIPQNLVETELFGFKKGAFTGATRDHPGLVRAAMGGTLLLDEVGDMPLEAQAKLLRMLESHEVRPVGGVLTEGIDVRVIAATHRDLRASVESGAFRGDLFARLNVASVALPPLRHRKEDLWMLVRRTMADAGAADRGVTFRFMVAVCHYDWPFNVRELVSAVRRAVSVSDRGPLDAPDLPEAVTTAMTDYGKQGDAPAAGKKVPAGRPSASELAELLREHHGNVAAVARVLGKDRAQIHRWMHQLGIDPDAFR
ncbi:MAG TPA: sigma 54-interacting transcriptional regulator [Polyangiaceae bacterium]